MCPHFSAEEQDVADFARRVALADKALRSIEQNPTALYRAVAAAGQRSSETLAAATAEVDLFDAELQVLSGDEPANDIVHSFQGFAAMKAARHEELRRRQQSLDDTITFCQLLGACSERAAS